MTLIDPRRMTFIMLLSDHGFLDIAVVFICHFCSFAKDETFCYYEGARLMKVVSLRRS